jgi:hypothetical protein
MKTSKLPYGIPIFYSELKSLLEKEKLIVYFNISLKGVPYLRVGKTKDRLFSIQYFRSTKQYKVFNLDRQTSLLRWDSTITILNRKGYEEKSKAPIQDFVKLIVNGIF